jgi:hypothetical protein
MQLLAAPTPPAQPLAAPTPPEGHAAVPVLPLIGPDAAGQVIAPSFGAALALPSLTLPADLTLLFEQTGLRGHASPVAGQSHLEPLTGSPELGPYASSFHVPSAVRATTTATPKVATAQAARVEASRSAQSSPEQKRRLPQVPPTHSADGGVGSGSGGGGSVAFVRSTRTDQPTVSPLVLIRLGARALHVDDVLGLRIERPG